MDRCEDFTLDDDADEPVPTETFGARVQEARRLWGEGDESALIAYLLNVPVEKVLGVRP